MATHIKEDKIMENQIRNRNAEGLWWKRFFYTVTGAENDYELGPNWFASVMGTGIIANGAASLPIFAEQLQPIAFAVWCLASTMLIGLIAATCLILLKKQNAWKRHFEDPMMAQFYGAPPMAMLTISGGTLLLGQSFLGSELAILVAWVLWFAGTIAGLGSSIIIPFRLFTRFRVRPDSAFGGG